MTYFSAFAKAAGIIPPATSVSQPLPHSTPPPEPKKKPSRHSKTLTKRTKKLTSRSSPAKKDTEANGAYKVKGSRVTKGERITNSQVKRKGFWNLPILSNLFGQSQTKKAEDDLDGDTVVKANGGAQSAGGKCNLSVNNYDESGNKNTALTKDVYSDQYLTHNDPRIKEWTDEEIWLFNKLSMRGKEPLFCVTWLMDFSNFPGRLFTRDPSKVFIGNAKGNIYNAARALDRLIQAGPRARDRLNNSLTPEKPLFRELQDYQKWTLVDGGNLQYKAHIPPIAIASANPNESVESVVLRITDKLHAQGRRYRNQWRHPDCDEKDEKQVYMHPLPTLFGFVVKYTVVAVVTWDCSSQEKPVRTLGTYNFGKLGYDVWNAIAVSIVMVRARNYLMGLDDEGELGGEIRDLGSDPDA